jgi:RNA polymerase sigma factor (TIGR02999 family)
MANPAADITMLLTAAAAGNQQAAEKLLPLVYQELRRLAQARMAKTPAGNTLQPTALVHEAFLRLVGSGDPGWNGRGHFFGAAAQAMRNILVDQARRKAAVKHGGQAVRVEPDAADLAIESPAEDVVALDEALKRFEQADPAAARVVMLKHFAGLSDGEVAAALNVSERQVRREWRFARAWLQRELGAPVGGEVGDDGR